MTPVEAMDRVKKAVGKEVALEMYADRPGKRGGFRFVSWDGSWTSRTGQDLTILVEEIENELRR